MTAPIPLVRPRRPSPLGLLRALAALLAILALGWCGGFAWFTYAATRPAPSVPDADGIVVLTGGAGRIEAGLDLLEQDRARLLLISGVSEHLELAQVLRAAGRGVPRGLGERISLGHAATSTVGNAIETASWARANGLHSLIVVTAGYHMRRAVAEIGTALPDVALYRYPVQPPAMGRADLWTLRLLAAEYSKWLAVECGLTGSAHLGEVA